MFRQTLNALVLLPVLLGVFGLGVPSRADCQLGSGAGCAATTACTSACHEDADGCDLPPDCPEKSSCPVDGHHHHNHVACAHGVQLSGLEAMPPGLPPPDVSFLGFGLTDALAPDGPVTALDKPPLI